MNGNMKTCPKCKGQYPSLQMFLWDGIIEINGTKKKDVTICHNCFREQTNEKFKFGIIDKENKKNES